MRVQYSSATGWGARDEGIIQLSDWLGGERRGYYTAQRLAGGRETRVLYSSETGNKDKYSQERIRTVTRVRTGDLSKSV